MNIDAVLTWRLLALFFFGCVLFSYPAMAIFNVNALVWGIPLLYLYIFSSWLLLIILIFIVTMKQQIGKKHSAVEDEAIFLTESNNHK